MTATAVQTQIAPTAPYLAPAAPVAAEPKPARPITWREFQRRFLEREDKFKYEWVNGMVVKTPRSMNQHQQFIWFNLKNFLERLRQKDARLGELVPEVETFFGPNLRRPDLGYFSPEQMTLMRTTNQEPQFVIEVISSNDQLNAAHDKLADYRAANIPVVWHIFPKLQQVHVYRGKNMTICIGDDLCSAEPVIPGFVLPTHEIFK